MKTNETKRKGFAPGIRMLGLLAIVGVCCMALVPVVAAENKWLVQNTTVYANNSYYSTINGVSWTNKYFFGVVGNGHYNDSDYVNAYTWNQSTQYSDRYYMDQLMVGDTNYPANLSRLGDYNWEFVSALTPTATLYKKGLGGYVNSGVGGTYYAWYGNRTYATSGPYGNGSWFCPTYDNATYVINLTVQWGP